jgi:hypothetical protein
MSSETSHLNPHQRRLLSSTSSAQQSVSYTRAGSFFILQLVTWAVIIAVLGLLMSMDDPAGHRVRRVSGVLTDNASGFEGTELLVLLMLSLCRFLSKL